MMRNMDVLKKNKKVKKLKIIKVTILIKKYE